MAASLAASRLLLSTSCSSTRTKSAVSIPKVPNFRVSVPKIASQYQNLVKELSHGSDVGFLRLETQKKSSDSIQRSRLYAILEEVMDRIEMHKNIGEQRNNWNTLMLNSINSITLTAAVMAGIASVNAGDSILAVKLSSTVLLASATGMAAVMNKIQPSQLVEEQRSATRLFTQLRFKIESILRNNDEIGEDDVKETIERVLCIDRAYPLPLIGVMLEKFPEKFKPATWWPAEERKNRTEPKTRDSNHVQIANGWNRDLETRMREIANMVKTRDAEEYEKLGNTLVRLNRVLAIAGPVLTGVSAISSAFIDRGSCLAGVLAVACASMAAIVNTLEHGGQVGMVFEMYRNTAGFLSLLEQNIESMIGETEVEKRENGEVFETKVAMKLGRSLSELKDLARKSRFSKNDDDETAIDEFASKLF